MRIDLWFNFFWCRGGGSDDRGLASVLLGTVAPRLTSGIIILADYYAIQGELDLVAGDGAEVKPRHNFVYVSWE